MHRYLIQTFFLWTITSLPGKISNFTRKQVPDVCYPHIGCFSQEPPWTTFIKRLPRPQSPKELQIKFYVMTRNTKHKPIIKDWKVNVTESYRPTQNSLSKLDFRSSRPMTAFHIHGMYENYRKNWAKMKALGDAYLTAQDVNIVLVAWDAKTMKKGYLLNMSNCRVVGAVAAKFIQNLIEYEGLTSDRIHIVGFSLGAHVAGYIGKRVPNIYRITGTLNQDEDGRKKNEALDAAQPGFENADPRVRLHYTDAQHVDALHTNARSLLKIGVGYRSPLGDVDFYFNGGSQQPGCVKPNEHFSWTAPREIVSTVLNSITRCSHMRSLYYWIEALQNRSCTMWGTRTVLPDYVVTKETMAEFGIPVQTSQQLSSNSSSAHNQHLKHECMLGNCLPVGLNTFNLNTRGVFYVETGSDRKSFCIPRDENGQFQKTMKKNCGRFKRKN